MGGSKNSALTELRRCGQAPWLDFIERGLLRTGALARMIRAGEVTGLTSNPTIFEKAIAEGREYDAEIEKLVKAGNDPAAIVDALTLADIRAACDLFRPVYTQTKRTDGFVSIEVSPDLAHDAKGTVAEAKRLWRTIKRPNLMIKIPATAAGLPAITDAIAAGINVNVTLIFALERYREVVDAYLAGLERRRAAGKPVSSIASVASFFVSRVDTAVDRLLDERIGSVSGTARTQLEQLRGKAAIANTKLAYEAFTEIFGSDRFAPLREAGAQLQRPLWASTSTKNPAYPDIYYVEALVGADTVNTLPPATLTAYKDHGVPEPRIHFALDRALQVLGQLAQHGVDLDAITTQLEHDGVASFAASWASLHAAVAARREAIAVGARSHLQPAKSRQKFERLLHTSEEAALGARIMTRDATLWAVDQDARAEITQRFGWLDCPDGMRAEVDRLSEFTSGVRRNKLTKVLLCGMGGSSLAPEVLRSVLGTRRGHLDLRVLDSTTPDAVRSASDWADPRKTLVVLASKSGTTTEVQAFFRHCWDRALGARKAKAGQHFVAITDRDTPLSELAAQHDFRATFVNPSDIGGRYSALSLFGLVPAALIGADLTKLLDRGRTMLDACRGVVRADLNPGLSLGALLAAGALTHRERAAILTDERLATFGDWVEQLLAESLGKNGKGVVPLVGERAAGAGRDGRVFVHLRVGDSRAHPLAATARAGAPSLEIRLTDPYDVAGEFVRWEIATVAAAWALEVNPFDQPDVQATKDYTRRLLLQLGRGHQPHATGVLDVNDPDLDEQLTGILREPRGRRYAALLCFLERTPARDRALATIADHLAARTRLPVTIGYGPRYLHSTGQLHKGGPDTVLPIMLTGDSADDLPIPGTDYTFAMLERAQAEADAEALRQAGRPIVHVHLGAIDRGLERLGAALEPQARAAKRPVAASATDTQ